MTAFLGQQHRWTKGLIQTARKLLPRVLAGRAPRRVKLEAWFHLTAPLMYLVMFLVTAIALPALFLATPFSDREAVSVGVGAVTPGTSGRIRRDGFFFEKATVTLASPGGTDSANDHTGLAG